MCGWLGIRLEIDWLVTGDNLVQELKDFVESVIWKIVTADVRGWTTENRANEGTYNFDTRRPCPRRRFRSASTWLMIVLRLWGDG